VVIGGADLTTITMILNAGVADRVSFLVHVKPDYGS
jgi:hypothetical protein